MVLQCQWRHRIDSSGDSFCCLPTEQAQHRQHKLCWACLTNVPLAPVKKFRTSKRWCGLQREAGWVLSCPLCPQPWHCCPPPSLTVQPTPGWVPGLSRTGAHSSHANSSFSARTHIEPLKTGARQFAWGISGPADSQRCCSSFLQQPGSHCWCRSLRARDGRWSC